MNIEKKFNYNREKNIVILEFLKVKNYIFKSKLKIIHRTNNSF